MCLSLLVASLASCGGQLSAGLVPVHDRRSIPTLQWKACTGNQGPSGAQCARLAVPVSYAHPNGPAISLALDRLPATGHQIGSLLLNPGGPGASGVDFLSEAAGIFPASIREHFSLVGFDPRGVARSAPVYCGTGSQLDYYDLDPAPTTPAGLQSLVAADKAFALGCQRHSGADFATVSTVNAARDMDRIRQALGEKKLNYFGFSYGTFLGATYAGMFPTHIRTMVLDGAINPALNAVTSDIDQSVGFENDFNDFATWCHTQGSSVCPWQPSGSAVTAYQDLIDQVRAHPVAVQGSNRPVGPALLFYGTAETLYSTADWPDLGLALAQLSQGNGQDMESLADQYLGRNANGSYSNELEANTVINCLDGGWPSISRIEADASQAEKAAPLFGLDNLYSGLVCAEWPVPETGSPHAIHAPGSPPIVVVGSTGDPATPYKWAQALARQLDHGVLITRVGDGHTGYMFSTCVQHAVNAYLLTTKAPKSGLVCSTDLSG